MGGQLLALGAAPALTRLYSPADFGIFTIISGVTLAVASSSALRFELAVPVPAEERDAHSLVALGLIAASLTAVIGTVVVALAGQTMSKRFNQPDLMPWLWLVPITAAVMGAYLVLNQLAVRNQRYTAIGRRNLFQTTVLVLTQLGAGAVGFRPGGLVLGLGLGQVAGAVSLLWGSGLRSEPARAGRRPQQLWVALKRYRRFPLLLTPSGLLNVLGLQVPVLIIALHYGDVTAGWLGLSQRVLALPLALVGAAAAQVYLGEFVRATRAGVGDATRLFASASRRLALVGLLVATVLLTAGPWLFSVVFGPVWLVSGEYARALSIGLAAQLVAAPLSQTLSALERQHLQLAWDIGRLVIVAGVTGLCALADMPAITTVWCFGLASALTYGGSWLLCRHAVRKGRLAPGQVLEGLSEAGPADFRPLP
ncbi:O-antigen flipase Wzx [Microlunatus lacustris]